MEHVRVHRREASAVGGARRHAPLSAAVVTLLAALIMLLLTAEAQAYAPGALIYAKRIGTITAPAGASAVAAGPNGVTAVVGLKANSSVPAGTVTMVAKYAVGGQRKWLRTYATSGGTAKAVAFDRNGNVYVAATLYRSTEDIGLLKYSAAGRLLWKRFYDGPASGDDWPEVLARAQRLLAERYAIGHVTLQPSWPVAPPGRRVIPVVPARDRAAGRRPAGR